MGRPNRLIPSEAQRPFITCDGPERWFVGPHGCGKTTAGFLAFQREVVRQVAEGHAGAEGPWPAGPWLILVPDRRYWEPVQGIDWRTAHDRSLFGVHAAPWVPKYPHIRSSVKVPNIGSVCFGTGSTPDACNRWIGGAYAGIWIDDLHLMGDPGYVLRMARTKARVGPSPFLLVTSAPCRWSVSTRRNRVWSALAASNPHLPADYLDRIDAAGGEHG